MFGIGFFELILIAVVVLIFVGPKKLPELMQQVGRAFVHVRRTTTEVRTSLDTVIRDAEKEIHDEKRKTLGFLNEAAIESETTEEVDREKS